MLGNAAAVALRQLLAFQADAGQPVSLLIDTAAMLPLFIVLNFVGLVLFSLVDRAWKGEDEWDRIKPLWGALIVSATNIVVAALVRRSAGPRPRHPGSPAGHTRA